MDSPTRRPLQVGLFLPTADGMLAGGRARWHDLTAIATLAEAVGFDALWVPDHLILQEEVTSVGIWEAWSLLAALAASTGRLILGAHVTCTAFRNPALLAKMAATVDEISGGRLVLGLGAGWHEPEFRAFGYPFDHRVSRFAEAIRIIHGLLRDGRIDHDGPYYQVRECELRPRGPRSSGPPILVGATGERMLRLTARYADAWTSEWLGSPASIPPLRDAVDAACTVEGRDPGTLRRMAAVFVDLPGHVRWWASDYRTEIGPATGSPAQLATTLRAFAAEGIGQVVVWLDPGSLAGVEAFAPVLALLDGD
jgi:alkanesulfonate monooxygenase SsuD/methylene tetrahydromethanopterin reductase-like flavin-dependent oxidoreductase (luciferase family)